VVGRCAHRAVRARLPVSIREWKTWVRRMPRDPRGLPVSHCHPAGIQPRDPGQNSGQCRQGDLRTYAIRTSVSAHGRPPASSSVSGWSGSRPRDYPFSPVVFFFYLLDRPCPGTTHGDTVLTSATPPEGSSSVLQTQCCQRYRQKKVHRQLQFYERKSRVA
jgi:hypothetical protein